MGSSGAPFQHSSIRRCPAAGPVAPYLEVPPMPTAFADRIQHQLLPRVSKPNRYLGNALQATRKPLDQAAVRVLLAFPDAYEIGLSNLGIRILHHVLNQRADTAAELTFAPWPDAEAEMRRLGHPAVLARLAFAGRRVRRDRLLAPVRAAVHQRAHDARSGGPAAAHARSRRAPPAGHRGRRAGVQPRADGRVHRRVRDRRRRGRDPPRAWTW